MSSRSSPRSIGWGVRRGMRRVLSLEVTKGDSQCPAASTRVHSGGGVGSPPSPAPPPECFYRKDHALPWGTESCRSHACVFDETIRLSKSSRSIPHGLGEWERNVRELFLGRAARGRRLDRPVGSLGPPWPEGRSRPPGS